MKPAKNPDGGIGRRDHARRGQTLAALLAEQRRKIETVQLEARISELEQKYGKRSTEESR